MAGRRKDPSKPAGQSAGSAPVAQAGHGCWRGGLPLLRGVGVVLRELRASDARALFTLVAAADIRRFTWPPPTTLDGFHRFIDVALAERRAGSYLCFAVTMDGGD